MIHVYLTKLNSINIRKKLNMNNSVLPQLKNLSKTLPLEGIISIEMTENIPIFRASSLMKNRIEELLKK